MVSINLLEDLTLIVHCAGRTYLLSVGEDDSLYIEEEGQHDLTVAVSDSDNTLIVQGQWVHLTLRED